ncbi:MAG: S8 family serine peptidase, partial [Planctomycetota bacterium]
VRFIRRVSRRNRSLSDRGATNMMGFKKFLYRRLPTGQGVGVLAVTTAALLVAGPVAANLDAADSTNADQLWSGGGLGLDLTGAGVTVGVWESSATGNWEISDTHETFASYNSVTGLWDGPTRVSFGETPSGSYSGHATHVASPLGGAHIPGKEQTWGAAPGVDIVSYSSSLVGTEIISETQIDISNHSYGNDLSGQPNNYGRYNWNSASLDNALFQRPKHLAFFAAGNDRAVVSFDYDTLSDYQTAKNNVVIGSVLDYTLDPHPVFNYDPYPVPGPTPPSPADGIATSWFSSYGPTDDGRLGVDLVANGDLLYSADDYGDTQYTYASGTSMASPNAAGTAALLLEHWRNENGGYTPDSATQKGLLMHTATNATAYGFGPDYATGYGLINAAEAAGHITESTSTPWAIRERHAWEDTLQDGDTLTIDLIGTGDPFKASLSWLDPAATYDFINYTPNDRTPKLVNDLDIWVTDEYGNTFYPWALDPDNPDADATRDDHNRVDNFTQVFVSTFWVGTELTLHIDHAGTLDGGSQDYALFITGALLPSEFTPIPEPGSLALLGMGGLLVLRRRRV